MEKILLFKQSQPVAKFLLMAASDLTDDSNTSGKLVKLRGYKNILDHEAWNDVTVGSVEHIVPQNGGTGWDSEKYKPFYDKDNLYLMHGIGNLVLCPQDDNSSFGNRPWSEKRIAYAFCSAPNEDKIKELESKFGDKFSHYSKELYKARYIPMLWVLSQVEEQDLNEEYIRERGRQIADLAWRRIAPWLGLDEI